MLHRQIKPGHVEEEEAELLNYVHKMDSNFYGLTRAEFLRLGGEFAKEKMKRGPFYTKFSRKRNFKVRQLEISTKSPRTNASCKSKEV